MLLGISGASLMGIILAGIGAIGTTQEAIATNQRWGIVRAGDVTRVGQDFEFCLPHPDINFEIQLFYKNKHKFIGVYSQNNLPKLVKDGAYVVNLD